MNDLPSYSEFKSFLRPELVKEAESIYSETLGPKLEEHSDTVFYPIIKQFCDPDTDLLDLIHSIEIINRKFLHSGNHDGCSYNEFLYLLRDVAYCFNKNSESFESFDDLDKLIYCNLFITKARVLAFKRIDSLSSNIQLK